MRSGDAARLSLLIVVLCGAACVSGQRRKEEAEMDKRIAEHNAQVEDEDDRIVCRRQRVDDSRRKEKICRRVRDWRNDQEHAQDMLRHARPDPTMLGGQPSPP